MKKLLFLLLTCVLIAGTSCNDSSIGIIGGSDGPTEIIVGKKINTTKYDEMPNLEGIPTPPGTFETAWHDDESGILHIEMSGVSDDETFRTYIATLYNAGFNSTWEQVDESSDGKSHCDEMVRCENDERSILLTWTDDKIVMTVSEK